MTAPDFSQHIPAIEDGIRLMKVGIYAKLAKQYLATRSEEDAAKLAFCVTASLFLQPLEHEKYSTFASTHADEIEAECGKVALDSELGEAASYLYAILIMLSTWQTRDTQVSMDLTERATDLYFVIPNIVQMWGARTVVTFHEYAEAFAFRHAEV
jgi:hypothetical protein